MSESRPSFTRMHKQEANPHALLTMHFEHYGKRRFNYLYIVINKVLRLKDRNMSHQIILRP